jgi:hypothetical protein
MTAIEEAYDRANSLLEQKFLRNAFLPVAIFPVVLAWPYLLQDNRAAWLINWWNALTVAGQLAVGTAYFAATWFVAAFVASQWRNIIRLFEGYPWENTRLGIRCASWHLEEAKRLSSPGVQTNWEYYYLNYPDFDEDMKPQPSDFLPTRLGNILRAAERYPYARYGAEPIILWPRLYHVMPREFLADVDEARSTLEFLLVTSLFCGLFGSVNLLILLATGAPLPLAVACFALGLLLSWVAYQSALPAAAEYGEHLRAGAEVYRLQLLHALQLKSPSSLEEEKATWKAVLEFIGRNTEDDVEDLLIYGASPVEARSDELA